jgi:hypothetical protein
MFANDPNRARIVAQGFHAFFEVPFRKLMIIVHRADVRSLTKMRNMVPVCVEATLRTANILATVLVRDALDLAGMVRT